MFRTLLVVPFLASSVAFANPTTTTPAASDKPATEAAKPATDAAAAPSFVALDKDLNSKLTTTEVAQLEDLTAEFATVDADKDGAINRTEFDAWTKVKAESKASEKPATPAK